MTALRKLSTIILKTEEERERDKRKKERKKQKESLENAQNMCQINNS
jgi:hypothetical protein